MLRVVLEELLLFEGMPRVKLRVYKTFGLTHQVSNQVISQKYEKEPDGRKMGKILPEEMMPVSKEKRK